MLKIRAEQMQAFDSKSLSDFENEMWEHCQEFAPQMCKVAKEENVRLAIEKGIEKSATYGFTNRGPVRFYIELMFTFGSDFDTDPQHANWLQPLFGEQQNQSHRSEQLFERYSKLAAQSLGEKNEILVRALERLAQIGLQDLECDGKVSGVFELVKNTYPERFVAIGKAGSRASVDFAISKSNQLGATSISSNSISAGLAIFLGHQFEQDPLYPWINRIFSSGDLGPDQRFLQAFGKSKTYLQKVIEYWGGI